MPQSGVHSPGLLGLLVVDGMLLGAIGLALTPMYAGAVPTPVGALLSIAVLPWLVLRAGELDAVAADVVEERERRRPADLGDERPLGQQEREHREALLALGAVRPQVALVAADEEFVPMRTDGREPPFSVAITALAQERGELLGCG